MKMWEHNNKYILGMLVSQFYKKLHKNVSAMVSFLQSYPDESEYVLSCFSKMAFFFLQSYPNSLGRMKLFMGQREYLLPLLLSVLCMPHQS
jgi:hypothetical protein